VVRLDYLIIAVIEMIETIETIEMIEMIETIETIEMIEMIEMIEVILIAIKGEWGQFRATACNRYRRIYLPTTGKKIFTPQQT